MSVPIESSRTSYTGNGVTTVYSTGWYFLEEGQVAVKHTPIATGVEVVLTLGVHYTVTMPASVGAAGSVTMLAAPAAGDALVLERDVSLTQDTSFRTQGSFSPAVHEDAMDSIVFAVQELARRTSDLESAGAPGSVVAGNGLSFSATTLHVGAGAGVQSNADTVEVLFGDAVALAKVSASVSSAGARDEAARSDHKHDVESGVPNDLVAGDTAAEGVSSSLALADHTHGVPVGAPTLLDATASATGSSGAFSDADHKHEVKSGAGATLTDNTNSAGTGPGFALEGHSHGHGARGGGTMHAEATSSAAGFMPAADRAIVGTFADTTLTTTDATVTTIATVTPTNTKANTIKVTVTAKDKSTGNSASYGIVALAKRQGGPTTLSGAVTALWTIEDVAGWDCTVDVLTPDVRVRVTGAAGVSIDWRCRVEVISS